MALLNFSCCGKHMVDRVVDPQSRPIKNAIIAKTLPSLIQDGFRPNYIKPP